MKLVFFVFVMGLIPNAFGLEIADFQGSWSLQMQMKAKDPSKSDLTVSVPFSVSGSIVRLEMREFASLLVNRYSGDTVCRGGLSLSQSFSDPFENGSGVDQLNIKLLKENCDLLSQFQDINNLELEINIVDPIKPYRSQYQIKIKIIRLSNQTIDARLSRSI